MIEQIVLIGAGRVASQLGPALLQAGIVVKQVYSRNPDKAASLAEELNSRFTTELERIHAGADVYILAVSDGAIEQVAASLSHFLPPSSRLVHTSGATGIEVLSDHFPCTGVFYPLQTFSAGRSVDWSAIPFCLEATRPELLSELHMLAQKIGARSFDVDSEQRATLHVAAVFANNFSNYLFGIAQEIGQAKNLSFDLLRPLILETASKVQEQPPQEAQTGPAVRHDQKTIERHLDYLRQHHPQHVALYELLTEGIGGNSKLDFFTEQM